VITTPTLDFGSNPEIYQKELAFRGAWNTQLTLKSCLHEFGSIQCDMEFTSDGVEHSVGSVPITVRLVVEDNEITSMNWSGPTASAEAPIELEATRFYNWVKENTLPGTNGMMFMDNDSLANPVLNEESLDLWLELLPQYEATLEE
jgi:hypothetical protein